MQGHRLVSARNHCYLVLPLSGETESGGGLIVAAVQVAITVGAAGGGAIYALTGVAGVFVTGGALMLATSLVIFTGLFRTSRS